MTLYFLLKFSLLLFWLIVLMPESNLLQFLLVKQTTDSSGHKFLWCLKLFTYLQETSHISINEAKTTDGAYYLELKIPSKSNPRHGLWKFLEKYGFRYGDMMSSRPLLASEVCAY